MFVTSSVYCYADAKILICCRWWSSHNCLNGWIYLMWSLIKQLRSPTVHYKTIKYCYASVVFILLFLEWTAILHVTIDKAFNACCLATLIQDEIGSDYSFPYSGLSSDQIFHISIIENQQRVKTSNNFYVLLLLQSHIYIVFIKN